MRVLEQLEPQGVFRFFEELCAIPHGSRNCQAVTSQSASRISHTHRRIWEGRKPMQANTAAAASEITRSPGAPGIGNLWNRALKAPNTPASRSKR